MKLYLSSKNQANSEYIHVPNILMLDNIVENCEAKEIVVDHFLCQFSLSELAIVLDKILSKLRINSTLTIKEKDIDILSMKYNRDDWSLEELNSIIFQGAATKSFVNVETIQEKLLNKVQIEQCHLDQQNGDFLIIARRLK